MDATVTVPGVRTEQVLSKQAQVLGRKALLFSHKKKPDSFIKSLLSTLRHRRRFVS